MAITPWEVAEKQRVKSITPRKYLLSLQDFTYLENYINKNLIENITKLDAATIWRDCKIKVDNDEQAYDYLHSISIAYRKAGWEVTLESERVYGVEGVSLCFKPAVAQLDES